MTLRGLAGELAGTPDKLGWEKAGSDEVARRAIQTRHIAPLPAARVYNSGAIVVNNAASKILTFDSERYDNDGIHSTSANTDRLTILVPGVYYVFCNVRWESNSTGRRELALLVNGATVIAEDIRSPVSGAAFSHPLSTEYYLAAGDYVTVRCWQNADAAANLNIEAAGNFTPEFGCSWRTEKTA